MNEHQPDGLDALEQALRHELDTELNPVPPRDFADVLGRIRDLSLGTTGDELLADTRDLDLDEQPDAPAPSLGASEATQLEAINADVRALLDRALEPRKFSAIPPARLGGRRWGRSRWRWAAAAAVLLMAGTAGAVSLSQSYLTATDASESFATEADDEATPEPSRGTAKAGTATVSPESAPPEAAPTPPASEEPQLAPKPPPRPDAATDRALRNDRKLGQLDREAYALFRAGNLSGAEKKFRRIVKIGGRSEYAELAYGELFSIAHQIDGAATQEKLWRSYLRRFPRGRYADGARAGLCRRAHRQERDKCWTRYLEKHPKGAARGEAIRETAGLP